MPAKRKTKANKRVLVQCATAVGRDAIRRETIDGVEHIIVSSFTLPDNIVMNGGLYPAEEIAASFQSLERTLAPVEHPQDSQGNFISATDPSAIHNFYAGAFNTNVTQVDGRIAVDKVINVQEARKSDRGKRLLDRIEELETNSEPRPVHTSVGVFLDVEETDGPQTNAAGQEFTWVARNMLLDHDAILLDSVGAAQPGQGVGMGVNAAGDEVEVQRFVLNQEDLVTVPGADIGDLSHEELRDRLHEALNTPPLRAHWIDQVFDERVIYALDDTLFSVPYTVGNGTVTISGLPIPVDREVSYTPRTNNEGDAMRELMLKALADAGVTVNAEITDDELMQKYNELQANQNSGGGSGAEDDGADDLAAVVANALKPVTDKLASLETKLNEKDSAETDRLAEIVGNSDKFPGIDVDTAKGLGLEKLKELAANCAPAYGVPLSVVNGGRSDDDQSFEMPK